MIRKTNFFLNEITTFESLSEGKRFESLFLVMDTEAFRSVTRLSSRWGGEREPKGIPQAARAFRGRPRPKDTDSQLTPKSL